MTSDPVVGRTPIRFASIKLSISYNGFVTPRLIIWVDIVEIEHDLPYSYSIIG